MGATAAYGGQAVIEGVMMRGPAGMAVAVRRMARDISVDVRARPVPGRFPWTLPVLRGLAALADSLVLGTSALLYSAEVAAADLTGSSAEAQPRDDAGLSWTLALSGAVGIGVFVVLPTVVAGWLRTALHSTAAAEVLEGVLRLVLLLGYILAIAAVRDVRRVLEYHGAEHKALAALESGLPLDAERVAARCSRFHPRCGTSFLLFAVLLAGFGYGLLGWQALWLRILLRLALLPLVAGLGYEVLRASARGRGRLAGIVTRPGLWLQHLTTREPDPSQVEVAIAALRAAMEMPGVPVPPAGE